MRPERLLRFAGNSFALFLFYCSLENQSDKLRGFGGSASGGIKDLRKQIIRDGCDSAFLGKLCIALSFALQISIGVRPACLCSFQGSGIAIFYITVFVKISLTSYS